MCAWNEKNNTDSERSLPFIVPKKLEESVENNIRMQNSEHPHIQAFQVEKDLPIIVSLYRFMDQS